MNQYRYSYAKHMARLLSQLSTQCGHGYSCLKITKPPEVFNMVGEFVHPNKRNSDITLFRGCFVLDVHKVILLAQLSLLLILFQDICHLSSSGLKYCWCSAKDLCNSGYALNISWLATYLPLLFICFYIKYII